MRIEAIPTGRNPPEDINVIIEVPIGGEPIKYEMDKASGALFVGCVVSIPQFLAKQTPVGYRTMSAAGAATTASIS